MDTPWATGIAELDRFAGSIAGWVIKKAGRGGAGQGRTWDGDREGEDRRLRAGRMKSRRSASRFIHSVSALTGTAECRPGQVSLRGLVRGLRSSGSFPPSRVRYLVGPTERETTFFGYPGLMSQAIENVVANGLEAMAQGGELVVQTTVESFGRELVRAYGLGDNLLWATLSVRDEGEGVAEDIREKIFEPFFTTKGGSIGLGLSIAEKIVRLHGGVIKLWSAPCKGSTFSIFLPVYRFLRP